MHLTVHVPPEDVDDVRSWPASTTGGRAEVLVGEPVVLDVGVTR